MKNKIFLFAGITLFLYFGAIAQKKTPKISITTTGAFATGVTTSYNLDQYWYLTVVPPVERDVNSPTLVSLIKALMPYELNSGGMADSKLKHAAVNGRAFNCRISEFESPQAYNEWFGGVNIQQWRSDFNVNFGKLCTNVVCKAGVTFGQYSDITEAQWYYSNLSMSTLYIYNEPLDDISPQKFTDMGTQILNWRNTSYPNLKIVLWGDLVYKNQTRKLSIDWRKVIHALTPLMKPGDGCTQYKQVGDRVGININNVLNVPGWQDESGLVSHPFSATDTTGNLQLWDDYVRVKLSNDDLVFRFLYPNAKQFVAQTSIEDASLTPAVNNTMQGCYFLSSLAEYFLRNPLYSVITYNNINVTGAAGREAPGSINYYIRRMLAPLFTGEGRKVAKVEFTNMPGCSGVCVIKGSERYLLINNKGVKSHTANKILIDGVISSFTYTVDQHSSSRWNGTIIDNYGTSNSIFIPSHSVNVFKF